MSAWVDGWVQSIVRESLLEGGILSRNLSLRGKTLTGAENSTVKGLEAGSSANTECPASKGSGRIAQETMEKAPF